MNLIRSHIPSHIRQIIFDWNGTLLDDCQLCVGIMNELLSERRLPEVTLVRYRELFRFPVRGYYQSLGFESDAIDELSDEWISRYNRRIHRVDLFAGCDPFIRTLRSEFQLAILSAAHEADIKELLQHHGIDDCFDHVYGLDNTYADGKEARGRQLMADLDYDPKTTLIIGDTDHDYHVGHDLGVEVLLLGDGHQCHRRLQSLPCPVLPSRYQAR